MAIHEVVKVNNIHLLSLTEEEYCQPLTSSPSFSHIPVPTLRLTSCHSPRDGASSIICMATWKQSAIKRSWCSTFKRLFYFDLFCSHSSSSPHCSPSLIWCCWTLAANLICPSIWHLLSNMFLFVLTCLLALPAVAFSPPSHIVYLYVYMRWGAQHPRRCCTYCLQKYFTWSQQGFISTINVSVEK